MQEVELAPFKRPAGRSVRRIVGIRLHAFRMTDMLNLVDGAEAAAARLAAGDEARDGCKDDVVSHLGTGHSVTPSLTQTRNRMKERTLRAKPRSQEMQEPSVSEYFENPTRAARRNMTAWSRVEHTRHTGARRLICGVIDLSLGTPFDVTSNGRPGGMRKDVAVAPMIPTTRKINQPTHVGSFADGPG